MIHSVAICFTPFCECNGGYCFDLLDGESDEKAQYKLTYKACGKAVTAKATSVSHLVTRQPESPTLWSSSVGRAAHC